ncbi:hypothetical protein U1Q18_007732 [Sarracenia purpurea var. burkii]
MQVILKYSEVLNADVNLITFLIGQKSKTQLSIRFEALQSDVGKKLLRRSGRDLEIFQVLCLLKRKEAATEFAISLIQTLLINDSRVISELYNLVDALAKLAERPGSPESLQQLVEVARNPAANYAANVAAFSAVSMGKEDNIRQAREKKAPGPSTASKEDYNVVESVEPDPAGFRKR